MDKRLYGNDLYNYLCELNEILQQRGAIELAEKVKFASRFITGSMSELFMEAELALKDVLSASKSILSKQEISSLQEKLFGIRDEFNRIGGA